MNETDRVAQLGRFVRTDPGYHSSPGAAAAGGLQARAVSTATMRSLDRRSATACDLSPRDAERLTIHTRICDEDGGTQELGSASDRRAARADG